MAKTTVAPSQAKPATGKAIPFIPKPTDKRAEAFFMLGALQGRIEVEFVNRLTELIIDLTEPAAPEPTEAN